MNVLPTVLEDWVVSACKIGAAEHMDDLVRNGRVYMNTAAFFAKLEKDDPRTDPHEGASYCRQAIGATLSVETDGKFEKIATLTGPIVHTADDLLAANLYCLHVRRANQYDVEFCLGSLGFGDTVVIFTDVVEFLRRVTDAAHRAGQQVSYRTVEYVDRESYTGPMGLFRKFSTHAAECEHRIAVLPGTSEPLSLYVGPLTDITVTVSADRRMKLTPKRSSA